MQNVEPRVYDAASEGVVIGCTAGRRRDADTISAESFYKAVVYGNVQVNGMSQHALYGDLVESRMLSYMRICADGAGYACETLYAVSVLIV